MKRLIFVRHGKAEDESPEISDFERSLTLKGKAVSRWMAEKLKEKIKHPGAILSSPAFRALETALIFAEAYEIEAEKVIMSSRIYNKMNLQNLPSILSIVNEETDVITLFGHNPSFTQLANNLSREGCDFIPKSGVVCISFNVMTWSDIARNTGTIEYFLKPGEIL